NPFAHGAFAWPGATGQGFVDDRHSGGIGAIGRSEVTAREQLKTKRLEEPRGDDVLTRVNRTFVAKLPRQPESAALPFSRQRDNAGRARRFHSRQALDSTDESRGEASSAFCVVSAEA